MKKGGTERRCDFEKSTILQERNRTTGGVEDKHAALSGKYERCAGSEILILALEPK
jgi:hypothetical protein